MAPFSIPAPHIVPLCISPFGTPKKLDTNTKIELLCDTEISHEIFYTIDGTKPQPYVGIVQGSQTIKYVSPFLLPAGKITVKAMAVHAKLRSMYSNAITKTYEVLKGKSEIRKNSALMSPTKKKKNEKIVDLNEPSVCNAAEAECSDHTDNVPGSSQKNISNGCHPILPMVDLVSEDNFSKNNHQSSPDSGSIGESLEDDRTIYEVDEISLLDEPISSSKLNSTLKPGNENNTPDFVIDENELNEMKDLIQFDESKFSNSNNSNKIDSTCLKCDKSFELCVKCQERNSFASKYCIHCGQRLKKICFICKEVNPMISNFCQFCGCHLASDSIGEHEVKPSKINENLPVEKINVGIQSSVVDTSRSVQTSPLKVNKSLKPPMSPNLKRLPTQSPGRGYWHQQLDFICNHLKSHAYNDVDFRKSISQPILSEFQSAEVSEKENNVIVTLVFSTLKKVDQDQKDC